MVQSSFKETTIPIEDSVQHVRADLRRRHYLDQPHTEVQYMTGVAGDYLHPDFVNFDVLALHNYGAFKARMLGGENAPQRLCIEPSDDSVERLTKAELVTALTSKINSSTSGQERDERLRELRRVSAKSKACLRELWAETMCSYGDDVGYDLASEGL